MKAIRVSEFGGPEVLRLEEVADPQPRAGEVLVHLHAAGVNPVETYVRSGSYAHLPRLPYTPGGDGAGEVVALGSGVTGYTPGERVYVADARTYAEMVSVPVDSVWPLPRHVTYEQGAAMGIPYRTAYLAVHIVGEARPGDWVLVRGGSGGVGTAAIQIAVAHGCRVVATAGSPEGQTLVVAQGALAAAAHDDVERMAALTDGHRYDLIVEMLANANLGTDLLLLADHGRVAIVGSRGHTTIDPRELMARSASVRGVLGMTAEQRQRIHAALGAGLRNHTLVPVVGRRFPLAEAAAAHTAVMSPGARGKVVLTMR